MVVACIGLAVALGGTSYAAVVLPRNSVGTPQLKKNAVVAAKVKSNAITGAKVLDNSLTGGDINEATLGQVPSAADADELDGFDSLSFLQVGSAAGGGLIGTYPNPTIGPNQVGGGQVASGSLTEDDLGPNSVGTSEATNNSLTGADIDEPTLVGVNADKVSGIDAFEIDYRSDGGPGSTLTILNAGGLSLVAVCNAGDLEVFANTSRDNSMIWVSAPNNALSFPDLDINEPDPVDVVDSDDNTAGTIVYARPDGIHVTISFLAEEDPFGAVDPDAFECVFAGTAFLTP